MKTKYYRVVARPVMPLGHYGAVPAQVGSSAPSYPIGNPRPMTHPQRMSLTAESGFQPLEPTNGSTLATECPPVLLADQAGSVTPGIVDEQ